MLPKPSYVATALKALDDAEFKFTYTDGVAGAITDEAANSKIQVDTDGVVTYEDGDVNITLGKFPVGQLVLLVLPRQQRILLQPER